MYYKINHSVTISEVGTQPQVDTQWVGPTDFWGVNSYTHTPLVGPIDFAIVFPSFHLSQLAKITDWFGDGGGISMNYFMVSARLYSLLQTYQMDEYQYFPAPVNTPGGIVDYHLIYFPYPREDDFIDWGHSLFRRITPSGESRLIQFSNSKERQLARDAHEIHTEKLIVHLEKIKVDIFRFKRFESGFYISEQLKAAMESKGMTGIRYEKVAWPEQTG